MNILQKKRPTLSLKTTSKVSKKETDSAKPKAVKLTSQERWEKLDKAGVFDWMKSASPALFENPVPMALGAGMKILNLFDEQKHDLKFSKKSLRDAIAMWCMSKPYLLAMISSERRIDIDGEDAGEITSKHKSYSKKLLNQRYPILGNRGKGGAK